MFVEEGTFNNDSKFYATSPTTWILFSRVDTITAGVNGGLVKTGTALSIATGGVTNAMLNGSIDQAKIATFAAAKNVTLNSG